MYRGNAMIFISSSLFGLRFSHTSYTTQHKDLIFKIIHRQLLNHSPNVEVIEKEAKRPSAFQSDEVTAEDSFLALLSLYGHLKSKSRKKNLDPQTCTYLQTPNLRQTFFITVVHMPFACVSTVPMKQWNQAYKFLARCPLGEVEQSL